MFSNQPAILNNARTELGLGVTVSSDNSRLEFGSRPVPLGKAFNAFSENVFASDHDPELVELIPPDLDRSSGIFLTHFSFEEPEVEAEDPIETHLRIGLRWEFDADENWQVIPLIGLTAVEAQLLWVASAQPAPAVEVDHAFSAMLTGTFSIGEDENRQELTVQIAMPDFSVGAFILPRPGSWTAQTLVDQFGFANIGAPLKELPGSIIDLELSRLVLWGDVRAKILTVEMRLSDPAEAESTVALNEISLRLTDNNGARSGLVAATTTIGTAEVDVAAKYGGPGVGWLFSGRSAAAAPQSIDAWLTSFHMSTTVPKLLSQWSISSLAVDFALGGRDAATLSETLALTFEGSINLGSANVDVAAKYGGRESGWRFSGRSAAAEPQSIGAWLDTLVSDATLTLPTFFEAISVSNLGVEFALGGSEQTTLSETLVLTCESNISIGSAELALLLAIAPGDERPFFGRIGLLGLDFTFSVIDAGAEPILLATYRSAEEMSVVALNLADLVAALLQADVVPQGLDVTMTADSALLAYGGGKNVLFGLDVSLADLSSLPLAGQYMEELGVKVGFRALATDKDFMNNNLELINSHLPEAFPALDELTGAENDADPVFRLLGRFEMAELPFFLQGGDEPKDGNGASGSGAPAGAAQDAVWMPIKRTLGPLQVARLGFHYAAGVLSFFLDTTLAMPPLTFRLEGLRLEYALADQALAPKIDGFTLAYRQPPLQMAGLFLEKDGEYSGSVLIKARTFSITAFGAYQEKDGGPSMFLYGALDKALGGPAFFYVTGLALGFGFNRGLNVPGIDGVKKFPLVAAARKKVTTRGMGASGSMLTAFNNPGGSQKPLAPVKHGAYWLAAGVKFTSFGIFNSFALLTAEFGRELEVNLLGISTLTLPKGSPKEPYVRAEMALKVSVKPAEGLISAEGQLTRKSYVIDPKIRIRGGFAAYFWFEGAHAGDFVVTLGGYNRRFIPPRHYPRVPRLSINWPIFDRDDEKLVIKGEAYFALTPLTIMAGGKLEATYTAGDLTATLIAYADFTVGWQPFFYDAWIGITVRASYYLGEILGRARAELSCELHIWGPEVAGTVTVSWTVFTLTFGFGDHGNYAQFRGQKDDAVLWNDFEKEFLPQPAAGEIEQPIYRLLIDKGLDREIEVTEGFSEWVVRPDELILGVETTVPLTSLRDETESDLAQAPEPFYVRPMKKGEVDSSIMSVQIDGPDGSEKLNGWHSVARIDPLPPALWGNPFPISFSISPETVQADVQEKFEGLTGLSHLSPPDGIFGTPPAGPPKLDLAALQQDGTLLDDLALNVDGEVEFAPTGAADIDAFEEMARTADGESKSVRNRVLAGARAAGFGLATDYAQGVSRRTFGDQPELALMAAVRSGKEVKITSGPLFQTAPMLGALGSGGRRGAGYTLAELADPPDATERDRQRGFYAFIALLQSDEVYDMNLLRQLADEALPGPQPASATAATATFAASRSQPAAMTAGRTAQAQPGGAFAQRLVSGRTVLYQLQMPPTTSSRLVVGPLAEPAGQSNDLALRLITLDKAGRLRREERRELGDVSLEPEDRFLAVSGLPDAAPAGDAAGWLGASRLLQLQPRLLVHGDTFVVPQVGRTIPRRGRQYPYGFISGRRLAGRTVTRSTAAAVEPGWIETWLPAGDYNTLVVAIRKDVDVLEENDPGEIVWLGGELVPLTTNRPPRWTGVSERVTFYRFRPSMLRPTEVGGRFSVRVRLANPWRLDGVLAFRQRRSVVERQWPTLMQEFLAGAAVPTGTDTVEIHLALEEKDG